VIFLCGAWFPVSVLPQPLQLLAWMIPITSAIDLTRAALNGNFMPRHLLELLHATVSARFIEWALRSLRRRMIA
jgi:ABC-type uncharacterized transport system permease subunit